MTKKQFLEIIKHHFNVAEESNLMMRETYYSTPDLMKQNIWVKKVQEYNDNNNQIIFKPTKTYYDIKIITVTDPPQEEEEEFENGSLNKLCYYQKVYSEPPSELVSLINEATYTFCFDVERKIYYHKENTDTKLTMDKVLFEHGETFVVFSLEGDISQYQEDENNITTFNTDDLSPCRSKIIELISKVDQDLYNTLIQQRGISDLSYVSMSVTEFEYGKEIANERKKQANELLHKLKNKGISDRNYLNFIYGQALANGVKEEEYSAEDYY